MNGLAYIIYFICIHFIIYEGAEIPLFSKLDHEKIVKIDKTSSKQEKGMYRYQNL